MTAQEIEILEKAAWWIRADADNSDDGSIRREAKELSNAIEDIIRKYQNPDG